MDSITINRLLTLLLKVGQMLLSSGAETYRAEETVVYMFNAIAKGKISVFAVPTAINIDIVINGIHYSGLKSVRTREINLEIIDKINDFSRQVVKYGMDIEDCFIILEQIQKKKQGKTIFMILSFGMAAGFFTLMLGGCFFEFLIAFISCTIVQLLRKLNVMNRHLIFFHSILGGAIPALIAKLFYHTFHFGDVNIMVIASMLPLFPGIATVNAIRDSVQGELISGVSRLAEAIVTAVALALGSAVIFALF